MKHSTKLFSLILLILATVSGSCKSNTEPEWSNIEQMDGKIDA